MESFKPVVLIVQHHRKVWEHILPLMFSLMLYCKGEVVHLLWLIQCCMTVDSESVAVQNDMAEDVGSLVGRKMEPDRGRVSRLWW